MYIYIYTPVAVPTGFPISQLQTQRSQSIVVSCGKVRIRVEKAEGLTVSDAEDHGRPEAKRSRTANISSSRPTWWVPSRRAENESQLVGLGR